MCRRAGRESRRGFDSEHAEGMTMRYQAVRAAIVGLAIAGAAVTGACQLAELGEPCNDGWCQDGMSCRRISATDPTQKKCVAPGFCRNGMPPPGELCELPTTCGNGVREPGEACDDGNTVDGDGCSGDCKSNEICGNNVVDRAAGETCDPPNTSGCDSVCHTIAVCGNGVLEA